jgi:putative FmdB family regulatory protein
MFYDYICPQCGSIKEENHGMTEEPVILCDDCSSSMKIKIYGGSGTHFKGTGWVSRPRGDNSQAKRTTITRKAEQIAGEE